MTNSLEVPHLSLEELTSETRPICYGVLKPGPFSAGGVPLLRIQDLVDDQIATDGFHRITEDLDEEFSRSRLRGGEVLLSIQGTIGRTAVVANSFAGANISRTLAVIEPDKRLRADFLQAYLQYVAECGGFQTAGSTRASLNIGTLRKMKVPVPPLDEQERVASSIGDRLLGVRLGIAALRQENRRLDAYAAAILRSNLQHHARKRLGDVCEVRSGYGFPKDLQGKTSGDLPFAKVRDISEAWLSDARYLSRANHYVTEREADQLRAKPFSSGTVVMAKIGEAVRLNRRAILATDALVDNNVMGWTPDADQVVPEYLFMVSLTQHLDEMSQSTTVPSVRTSEVKELMIPVPPPDEQARVVAKIDQKLDARRALLQALGSAAKQGERLRVSVLHDAFGGTTATEVVPSVQETANESDA